MIRKLSASDIDLSAKIHLDGMPDDFLASFGLPFLRLLHELLLQDSNIVALGFYSNKKLVGIALGSTNTAHTMRFVYRTGWFKSFPFVVKRILSHPLTLLHLLQTLLYSNTMHSTVKAELLILSVHEGARGKSIGSQLLKTFFNELRKKNIKKSKVATRESNQAANALYRKFDGEFSGKFHIYNRTWFTYIFTL